VRGSPEQDSDEVAVLDVASGAARVLTKNPYQERYPEFSSDGSRIYFESHDDDPVFPEHRYVSVIASVPARP
jgi:Tol biopolymer transport system component